LNDANGVVQSTIEPWPDYLERRHLVVHARGARRSKLA
jgi:hypothetical protein